LAADDAPNLVCTDIPALLAWTKPMPGPYPPAFGTANTTLSIPINRRMIAVSSFEGQPPFNNMRAEAIGAINGQAISAAKQIYSAEAEFIWRKADNSLTTARECLDLLMKRASDDA
jgi:hypothetical protein